MNYSKIVKLILIFGLALILSLVTVVMTEYFYRTNYIMYFPMPWSVTTSTPIPCENSTFINPDGGCGFTEQISSLNAMLDLMVYVVVWFCALLVSGKIISLIRINKKEVGEANGSIDSIKK